MPRYAFVKYNYCTDFPMDDTKKSKDNLVTELKELQKQNNALRSLVDNSKDMLFRMSLPDGEYEYVSAASYEIFGYSPEEFYRRPLLIMEIIHPDWRTYFKEQWDRLISSDMAPSYEYQIIHKSGDIKWVHQKNVLIHEESGNPVAIEGIVSDITERRKMEEALRLSEANLMEAQQMAHLGYWYWDVNTGNVEWSREVYNIFRLDPDQFTPKIDSILSLSPWPEDHKRDEELIQKAIKSREQGSYEQRFLLPDGGIGHYLSTFQGIYDENDELVAIRGTVQDITERKRAEEEKARLKEQYRQAQKVESIGRLAGGVAHDLNNLLTPILGYSEMLMIYLSSDDKRAELVKEILSAGLRARDLVGQLLAFGRKQTLEYRTLDMKDVIKGFEKLLRRTIREDIQIRIVPSNNAHTIRADIGQIEQVILNLAVNAQDAMPEGGTLTIETENVKLDNSYAEDHFGIEAGDYVMLTISDTGCGMDEETQRHIFEPFFSTKGNLGTGLGLATVYGIVKQHGGSIFVYSESDKGTTIKIYMPFFEGEHVSKDAKEKSTGDLRGSETILLVEDNEHVRRLSRIILQHHGYTVLEAENGRQALTVLDSHEYPVQMLLTDVIMPGMNGRELFAEAMKRRPGLKVLYMSGYTDNVIAHHGILNEGIQFIQKPFSSETLAAKIREVLDSK